MNISQSPSPDYASGINQVSNNYDRFVCLFFLLFVIWRPITAKLEAVRTAYQQSQRFPPDQRSLALMLYIVALLGEHCDFDAIRANLSGTSRMEMAERGYLEHQL